MFIHIPWAVGRKKLRPFFWRGAGRRRAHERIATKKLCLSLVTSRGGGRRGESRRERPDVSWRKDG